MYVCMYVCVCVCVCVCVYIYILCGTDIYICIYIYMSQVEALAGGVAGLELCKNNAAKRRQHTSAYVSVSTQGLIH
jgi:hypothetical protein